MPSLLVGDIKNFEAAVTLRFLGARIGIAKPCPCEGDVLNSEPNGLLSLKGLEWPRGSGPSNDVSRPPPSFTCGSKVTDARRPREACRVGDTASSKGLPLGVSAGLSGRAACQPAGPAGTAIGGVDEWADVVSTCGGRGRLRYRRDSRSTLMRLNGEHRICGFSMESGYAAEGSR
jgi:hypothetical protein